MAAELSTRGQPSGGLIRRVCKRYSRLAAFEAAPYVLSGKVAPLDLGSSVAIDFIALNPEAASQSPLVKDVLEIARRMGRDLEASQEYLRRAEVSGDGLDVGLPPAAQEDVGFDA